MNIFDKLKKVDPDIWFAFIFIFASFFYLFNINFSDIWIDESFTKALVKHSYAEIIQLIKNDFHPPLYFFGLKIFTTLFGLSDFNLRVFSVLGILCTILLVYISGRKVFGQYGSIYFCMLILSLPMLAQYAHEARMYSWGSFAVSGTFLFVYRYISSNNKKDLVWCLIFSLMGAYTHYYALLAAFCANLFLLVFLLLKRKNQLNRYLIYLLITCILYLPWLIFAFRQTQKVAGSYWVQTLDFQFFLTCILSPFAPIIYLPPFLPLAVIIYAIMLWMVYYLYIAGKQNQGLLLGLSLSMFWGTILIAILVSLIMQPIFYMRYLSNIVILLLVPVTLLIISIKNNWIKGLILTAILFLGIRTSYQGSFFSYGPYQQSLDHLHHNHPEIKKIFHVVEGTAGPLTECRNFDIKNYWYNPKTTIVYTNMEVFDNLLKTDSPGKVLKADEPFCLVKFPLNPFNENNVKQIMSESQLSRIDTVFDRKMNPGVYLILYMLKYKGTGSKI